MKTELVAIGESRGIRIPNALIEQCGFGNTVDVRVDNDRLIITRTRKPREGWEESFQSASPEDELLLERVPPNKFDIDEWEW